MHLHVTLFCFLLLDFFSVWAKRCHRGHLPPHCQLSWTREPESRPNPRAWGPSGVGAVSECLPRRWTLTSKLAQTACRSATLGGGSSVVRRQLEGEGPEQPQSHPKLVGLPRGVYRDRLQLPWGQHSKVDLNLNSAIRREIRVAFPSSLQPPVRP